MLTVSTEADEIEARAKAKVSEAVADLRADNATLAKRLRRMSIVAAVALVIAVASLLLALRL